MTRRSAQITLASLILGFSGWGLSSWLFYSYHVSFHQSETNRVTAAIVLPPLCLIGLVVAALCLLVFGFVFLSIGKGLFGLAKTAVSGPTAKAVAAPSPPARAPTPAAAGASMPAEELVSEVEDEPLPIIAEAGPRQRPSALADS